MRSDNPIEPSVSLPSLAEIRNVYFIGIGGIGMSAIARYFHSRGVQVSGYDKTATELTRELEASGIAVHYHEDVALAPKDVDFVSCVSKDRLKRRYSALWLKT